MGDVRATSFGRALSRRVPRRQEDNDVPKTSRAGRTAAVGLLATVLTVATQSAQADELVTHHEFQANCSVTVHRPDDPIVSPGLPGASHLHTFLGNSSVNASSTNDSLKAGQTNCRTPDDKSAYWFPSLYHGDRLIVPDFPQVISPTATQDQFRTAPGAVEGWECGNSAHNWDFPSWCPPGSRLNIRYQAPSCWNGRDLDSPDHKSHMAYPDRATLVCPSTHPVPVPMLEFEIAFPVSGDMSRVRLSSGRGKEESSHPGAFADAPGCHPDDCVRTCSWCTSRT